VRYLTAEEVILIHERILEKFGGAGGHASWRSLAEQVDFGIGTYWTPRSSAPGQPSVERIFT